MQVSWLPDWDNSSRLFGTSATSPTISELFSRHNIRVSRFSIFTILSNLLNRFVLCNLWCFMKACCNWIEHNWSCNCTYFNDISNFSKTTSMRSSWWSTKKNWGGWRTIILSTETSSRKCNTGKVLGGSTWTLRFLNLFFVYNKVMI